jgi:hypothetical protein
MSEFAVLASVLAPAQAQTDVVVRPVDAWRAVLRPEGEEPASVVLRGRDPARRGTPGPLLLRWAVERELALAHLRVTAPAPFRTARIYRLRPPLPRAGRLARVRASLAGGAAVRMERSASTCRLGEVVSAAGVTADRRRVRVGSGGAVLVPGQRGGRPVILRVLPVPRASGNAADALARLAGHALVPELLGRGHDAGLDWVLETRLPGRPPHHLSATLVHEAADFCAGLPRGEVPLRLDHDFAALGRLLPDLAWPLRRLGARAQEGTVGLQPVAVHGDLWAGNLLARRGHLCGVVYWDAARPAGVPGVDLLHLVATDDRHTHRRSLGAELARRPWWSRPFEQATARYWSAYGLVPTRRQLAAVGAAWWVGQVLGTLERFPELAQDDAWVSQNVVPALGGGWSEP